MAGTTIDHLVAVTIFLGAMLLFLSLFNQTIQTAIIYQRHRNMATKCSDLLDNTLLNPGNPMDWGKSNCTPTGFGLQDPEFTQYKLSPFTLMRLQDSSSEPVYYPKTGEYYSNITTGFGDFLLMSYSQAINYSEASKLLGINNSYGFQLTVTPIVTLSIVETQAKDPLKISVHVTGTSFPLINAEVSYCFIRVVLAGGGSYPAYTLVKGTVYTDETGSALIEFADVTDETESYAFIAYAHLGGLVGVGYHQRISSDKQYVIPFIENLAEKKVLIAHSYDVHYLGPPEAEIAYNATFVLLSQDFVLREMPLENSTGKMGKVNYGEGKPYGVVTIPTYNPGIFIITYRKSAVEGGVILMPWGMSAMGLQVVFGDDPFGKEWVSTDIRQVLVDNIAYQARLSLWDLGGYQVR